MPESDERHYNIQKLNRLFAIASLVLLISLGWMFFEDYARNWKNYQREFRQLEVEKTRVKFDKEANKLYISGAVPGRRGTLLEIRG